MKRIHFLFLLSILLGTIAVFPVSSAKQAATDAKLQYKTAQELVKLKNLDSAITCLKKAVDAQPDFADALELLGSILASRMRCEEALPYLTQAAQLHPSDPILLVKVGRAYKDVDKGAEAMPYIRRAMNIAADKAVAVLVCDDPYLNPPNAKKNEPTTVDMKPAPTTDQSTSITTTTTTHNETVTSSTTVKGAPTMNVQIQSSDATTQAPVANKPSKLIFMSATGQCDIFVDGKKCAEIGIPGLDEMQNASVEDLKPGTYLLRVEHFMDVWYDGKIQIGSGEQVKIRVDPAKFEIISRDPIGN